MTLPELARALDLDAGPRRVLVVEDAPLHHEATLAWLARQGHAVAALAEVGELDRTLLRGRDLQGETIEVDLAALDAALLDYYFPRPPWDGRRLAETLVRMNPRVRVFGMSSVDAANERMVRAGALAALRKDRLGDLIARA